VPRSYPFMGPSDGSPTRPEARRARTALRECLPLLAQAARGPADMMLLLLAVLSGFLLLLAGAVVFALLEWGTDAAVFVARYAVAAVRYWAGRPFEAPAHRNPLRRYRRGLVDDGASLPPAPGPTPQKVAEGVLRGALVSCRARDLVAAASLVAGAPSPGPPPSVRGLQTAALSALWALSGPLGARAALAAAPAPPAPLAPDLEAGGALGPPASGPGGAGAAAAPGPAPPGHRARAARFWAVLGQDRGEHPPGAPIDDWDASGTRGARRPGDGAGPSPPGGAPPGAPGLFPAPAFRELRGRVAGGPPRSGGGGAPPAEATPPPPPPPPGLSAAPPPPAANGEQERERGGGGEGEECPVCQEGYSPADEVGVLRCGHCFHLACVTKWVHRSPSCPLCRVDLREAAEGAVEETA